MLTLTHWQKEGTDPRLYISPNTPGNAYVYLLKGGQPRVRSAIPHEIHSITAQLSPGGLMNTSYSSYDEFVSAIEDIGHTITKRGGRAPAGFQSRSPYAASKEDFCNTKSPGELHTQSLCYNLRSIKFNKEPVHYTITVDTREPASIVQRLEQSGLVVINEKLDVGDIRITSSESPDELIIERKTVSDLYSSIVAKTAHRQAECLYEYSAARAQSGARVMVVWLIEGELSGQRMLYNAFPEINQTDGVINFFTAILGQHVLQAFNQHHLAYLTIKLAQGFFEQQLVNKVNAAPRKTITNEAESPGRYHGVRTSDKNTLMQVLLSVPSLKEPVVKAIMAKGHRLKEIMQYTEADWLQYDGVGKVTASKIIHELSQI